MKYSSRFFLYAPLGVFLILLFGVGVHWWIAASHLSARLAALNGKPVAPGVTMHYAERRISGFPFSLDTKFRGFALELVAPSGPMEWRPEEFAMHALTYGRDETIFEAAGKQTLRWTRDGGARSLTFETGALHASAIDNRNGLARFDLDIVGFGSPAFTAQHLQLHFRRDGPGDLDYVATADELRTPAGTCPRLDDHLAKMELTGTVTRAEALAPVLAGDEDWPSAVARWRAAGGNSRIESLVVQSPAGRSEKTAAMRTALAQTPVEKLTAVSGLADALCRPDH